MRLEDCSGRPGTVVELRGITKRFGDLVANDSVDLDLHRGEIHALLGENGAGKTTLMRILYGLTAPDAGEIRIEGNPVRIRSPKDAIALGIGMVTQHFALVRPMTVAENLQLGAGRGIRLDREKAERRVVDASERFGIRVLPSALVAQLSVGEQQRVEILKALARDCRVLILDEPTAVLVPQEVEALFSTLRRLSAAGMAVVFISHKLTEVSSITDRVTILRRGSVVGEAWTRETDERSLALMMVGRPAIGVRRVEAQTTHDRGSVPRTERSHPVLRVSALSASGGHGLAVLHEVSFQIAPTEIVGVAGVSGNGQGELVEILSGTRRPTGGSIEVDGQELRVTAVPDVLAAGIGRIPEDRHGSLVGDLSVAHNLLLERIDDFRRGGRLDERRIRAAAEELIDRFSIRARPDDPVRTLSGGNMQKVLLARVLAREPKVIVVSQPTRGLDVGSTDYVRSQLLEQRARGAAILLVSEDLDELLALADRLLVMYEGRIVGEMAAAQAEPVRLGLLMAGRGGEAAA